MSEQTAPAPKVARRSDDLVKRFVPVLIALVTILSALTGWRATVAANQAGGADSEGLAAAMDAEEARTVNTADAFAHYTAYTDFARNQALADALTNDLNTKYMGMKLPAAPAAAARIAEMVRGLEQRRDDAYDLASANQYFFVTRYLSQNGTYNLQREMDELAAGAARQRDLNPDAHFALADQLRAKTAGLVGMLVAFAVSILLFTVALEGTHGKLSVALTLSGMALTGLGSVIALLLEFGVLILR